MPARRAASSLSSFCSQTLPMTTPASSSTPSLAASSFDLTHFWLQADAITRGVALVLLLMSLLTWIIMVGKAWEAWRCHRLARRTEQFWHSPDMAAGMQLLGESETPFRALAQAGLDARAHHRLQAESTELHDTLPVSDWISLCLRHSMDSLVARLQAGLSVLASIGSTAPFIGLFGTVWGIYHALMGLGGSGAVSIDRVAGPIGEALVMTALGLAVAIPAVLGYNTLVRANKHVSSSLARFSHDLHACLVTGARVA